MHQNTLPLQLKNYGLQVWVDSRCFFLNSYFNPYYQIETHQIIRNLRGPNRDRFDPSFIFLKSRYF
jgi:hypothetical protein